MFYSQLLTMNCDGSNEISFAKMWLGAKVAKRNQGVTRATEWSLYEH